MQKMEWEQMVEQCFVCQNLKSNLRQEMEQFSCSGQIKFFIVQQKTKEGINTVWRFSKKNLY